MWAPLVSGCPGESHLGEDAALHVVGWCKAQLGEYARRELSHRPLRDEQLVRMLGNVDAVYGLSYSVEWCVARLFLQDADPDDKVFHPRHFITI